MAARWRAVVAKRGFAATRNTNSNAEANSLTMTIRCGWLTAWKWCALTSLALVAVSFIPQVHFWIVRGRNWNGNYVMMQGDEPLYSGYINALIDGRPRKNDPFGAKDNTISSPLPESTFSIQFIPAYAIALTGKLLNICASTTFILLSGFTALISAITIFWLIFAIIDDSRLACAGTLLVLFAGGALGTYALFGNFLDGSIPALPFLRRYEPAVAFPFFFLFQLIVWRAVESKNTRMRLVASVLAGLILSGLVFSYLYLWTAAAVWVGCLCALLLYFQTFNRRSVLVVMTIIAIIAAGALGEYAYMLSHRGVALDQQHTLVATHLPDVFRLSEIISATIIITLLVAVRTKRIQLRDPRLAFAGALALLPMVIFNQQILTGKTMQVFHYDVFIINYSTLIAVLVAISIWWHPIPRAVVAITGVLAVAWGVFSVVLPSSLVFVPQAIARDQRVPVLRRLRDLRNTDNTRAELREFGAASTLVFSPDLAVTVLLPTWTTQGTLLDIGGVECATILPEERKHYFYMHLYYSNVTADVLRRSLTGTVTNRSIEHYASIAVFGSERASPVLGLEFKPIRPDEIEHEVQIYETYTNTFSREEALKRPIKYAVIPVDIHFDFSNLDRWYERDAGEQVGDFVLYTLKLKD